MPDLRSLSTATGEEGARLKHERLHRPAMPDIHLRGGRQNRSGYLEANHASGDVQRAATERGGTGSGGRDYKKMNQLIDHLREDVGKVTEPKAQALFETSAEVLTCLVKAFDDYENKGEEAWRTEPMASCPKERITNASRR